MNAWDKVMPHRLLLNRSLRKAADGSRSRAAAFQQEIARYKAEIELAKANSDRDVGRMKASLASELKKDKAFFDTVEAGMVVYIDLYFQYKCLEQLRKIKENERQTFVEYRKYLSEQMNLIGDEIKILDDRKNILATQASVDDIVELIGLSGCDLSLEVCDDARALLKKVNAMLSACDDNEQLKRALKRLRAFVQERVDYLAAIAYTDWIIQQKIQTSKQCKTERLAVDAAIVEKDAELPKLSKDCFAALLSLQQQARAVRACWENPITELDEQINAKYRMIGAAKRAKGGIASSLPELKEISEEIREIKEALQQMREERSRDSARWDGLCRDKEICFDKIEEIITQTDAEITPLEAQRQQWFERMQMIYALAKQNRVALLPENISQKLDECEGIDERLAELERKAQAETALAQRRAREEQGRKQKEKSEKEAELHTLLESAKRNQLATQTRLAQAAAQLLISKQRDTRFFLTKLFKDTDEIRAVKRVLQGAEAQKRDADAHVVKSEDALAIEMRNFDRRIKAASPRPYSPPEAEKEEIQRLEKRKNDLMVIVIKKDLKSNRPQGGRQ